jgi:hypothetical protein
LLNPDPLPLMPMLQGTLYLAFATIIGGAIGLVYPGRRLTGISAGERRLAFWNGKVGQAFAKLAAFKLPRRASPEALANRPTELAIGLAVAELYKALPRETQRELRDLPNVVRKLEEDAQQMRKRISQCDDAIANADVDRPGSLASRAEMIASPGEDALDEHRRSVVGDLRTARDSAGRKLAIAVAALENIRLDLLRLQAGAGSVDSLTSMLTKARRIGDEATAIADARVEVEDVVRTPS